MRDEYLKESGIKTIRIQNRFVFQDPEYVKRLIISGFIDKYHTTPPSPPAGGSGTPPNLGGETIL
jgi:hypothetical protein